MQDKELVCVNPKCGDTFVWTAGEQNFMQNLLEQGKIDVVVEPKRCPDCRRAKKERFEKKNNRN
jgi:hypothetical protein